MARVLLCLVILASLCVVGCARPKAAPPPAAHEQIPEPRLIKGPNGTTILDLGQTAFPGMTTATVAQVQLPGQIRTTGQIAFDQHHIATIVSRVAGRIEQTRVSQWDYVRRGEPIVELYSPDFMTAEEEYLQAQATANLSDSTGMRGAAGMAKSMVSAARRKLELLGMSRDDIAAVHSAVPTIWMRAPISGTVLENKAIRGAAVSPGDVLYTLGNIGEVWIVANIYEDDLSRVHEGQELEAVTTAYPGRVFSGVISRISPNIDPASHTLQIRCKVRNPGGQLKPQMLANIKIVTRPSVALVVPEEALVFDTNHYYAFVDLGHGRFARREVTIASWKERGLTRVLSGLTAGERVVAADSLLVDKLWHEAHG